MSSREIARRLETDVAFRVLAANYTPSHRTICRFRKEHLALFQDVFLQVVKINIQPRLQDTKDKDAPEVHSATTLITTDSDLDMPVENPEDSLASVKVQIHRLQPQEYLWNIVPMPGIKLNVGDLNLPEPVLGFFDLTFGINSANVAAVYKDSGCHQRNHPQISPNRAEFERLPCRCPQHSQKTPRRIFRGQTALSPRHHNRMTLLETPNPAIRCFSGQAPINFPQEAKNAVPNNS